MLKNNIYKNPSFKNVMVLSILWFTSNMLLVLSITDLFTESFFHKRYLVVYFLMLGSTATVAKVSLNYFKNK